MKKRHLFWLIPLIIILAVVFLRIVNSKEIDDLNPEIACPEINSKNFNTLWVIPLFNNKSIAKNETWCKEILNMNKTIGMHGVYHSYNEFETTRDKEYIQKGIEEFEKCFGFKPKIFKAPQLALSIENKNELKKEGLEIRDQKNQLFHKVYHCNNTGKFSNELINFI